MSAPYRRTYQGEDEITSHEIENIVQGRGIVFSEVVQQLASLNQTVGAFTDKMDQLAGRMNLVMWFVVGAAAWISLFVGLAAILPK